jgi:uncharacterized protein (TIGR02996 family)
MTNVDPGALLRAVYESPDDMALRMVLADALIERGDPRGELIVLQAQREDAQDRDAQSTKKALLRERALLKKHMREWLGPLTRVVVMNTAVFERGFLARCVAQAKDQRTADLHFHYPEWATVRSIEFRNASRITTAMRGLRDAAPLDEHGLRHLATHGHPTLERLLIRRSTVQVTLSWDEAAGAPGGPVGSKTYLVAAVLDCIARFGPCGAVRDLRLEGRPHVTFSEEHRSIITTRARQFPKLQSATYPWSQ